MFPCFGRKLEQAIRHTTLPVRRYSGSVELTWEEIRHVCAKYGLEIVHEDKREAMYNANRSSLMRTTYTGVLCCAVKNTK